MPETFCQFEEKIRTLENFCLLPVHYFSTPRELATKMDIVEDSALNGKDQGNHKSQMLETSMLHLTVSIKGVTKIPPNTTMAMRDEVRGEAIR